MNIDINALLAGKLSRHGNSPAPAAAERFNRLMAEMPDHHPLLLAGAQGDLPPDTALAAEGSPEPVPLLSPQQIGAQPQENPLPDKDAGALLTQSVMPEGWEQSPLWQLQQAVIQRTTADEGEGQPLVADKIPAAKTHNPLPQLPLSLQVSDKADAAVSALVPAVPAAVDKAPILPVAPQLAGLTEAASPAEPTAPGIVPDSGVVRPPQSAGLAAHTSALPVPAVVHNAHPPGSAAWQHSLSQQLALFTRDGVQNAEIRLHPEELGSLQITVRMQQEQAQLHIISEHPLVRQALEAALPQLRQALAESGVQLGQTSVSAEGSASAGADARQRSGGEKAAQSEPGRDDAEHIVQQEVTQRGWHSSGINTFA